MLFTGHGFVASWSRMLCFSSVGVWLEVFRCAEKWERDTCHSTRSSAWGLWASIWEAQTRLTKQEFVDVEWTYGVNRIRKKCIKRQWSGVWCPVNCGVWGKKDSHETKQRKPRKLFTGNDKQTQDSGKTSQSPWLANVLAINKRSDKIETCAYSTDITTLSRIYPIISLGYWKS